MPIPAPPYLGDFREDAIVDFLWTTEVDVSGNPTLTSRTTQGTVVVYKDNSTTQISASIVDTIDFDGVPGLNHLRVNMSGDPSYNAQSDYVAYLSGAVLNGVAYQRVLCSWSCEYRTADIARINESTNAAVGLQKSLDSGHRGTLQAATSSTVTLDTGASAQDDFYNDSIVIPIAGTGAGQSARLITDYVGSTKVATITPNWDVNPDTSTEVQVIPMARASVGTIDGSVEALQDLKRAAITMVFGTVDTTTNGHTPTTTEFQSGEFTEATADHYKGRSVVFKAGALKDQATAITAYSNVGGIGQFTVSQMTDAPTNGDTFILV